tara:strand:+ start:920 stop:1180 length:261 start_codon:yes stop_codon:yes gene_type:complete
MSIGKISRDTFVNAIARGINSDVKEELRTKLVNDLCATFSKDIEDVVDAALKDLIFSAEAYRNPAELRTDLEILIKHVSTTQGGTK